jgi:hypothetical protein
VGSNEFDLELLRMDPILRQLVLKVDHKKALLEIVDHPVDQEM